MILIHVAATPEYIFMHKMCIRDVINGYSRGVLPTRPQDLCESNADDSVGTVSMKNTDLLQLKHITVFFLAVVL